MSHIFISYSRRDLSFAQQIVDALAAQNLEMWIDWKSIPKGEDWEQEIYRGIEKADALLFLISPESIRSKMCNKEIIHALKNGKRILPILLHKTITSEFLDDTARVEIERLNWVFCQKDVDDFNAAIDQIRNTIQTDYDWVRFHTALLTKALAWERARQDRSRLLRGGELKEAEQQLARAKHIREPLLTDLQRLYIRRSKETTAAQRRLPFIAATGLISLFLVSFVWFDKSWYSVWPIRKACPSLTQISIEIKHSGLSPAMKQGLDEAVTHISRATPLRYCKNTQLSDATQVQINASNQGSPQELSLEILFPKTAAYRLDFLPEIRQLGPEIVSLNEARALVQAAAAYSLGDYEQAVSILGEASDETTLSGLIMLAQSHLFLDHLDTSRSIYELALQKAGFRKATTDLLHMGAALAYWRPLLYDNSYAEQENACSRAKAHYENVEPWEGGDFYVNNVKIVYAYEYHCDDPDWEDEAEQLDTADANASGIAYFIQAKRCTPDNLKEGCDYFTELTSAEQQVVFARALLIRHYYLRETENNCARAEPFLNSFRNEAISRQEITELRDMLKLKARYCS